MTRRRVVTGINAAGRSVVGTGTTSREALATAALDASARSALHDLVLAVETSLFGGADIGHGDYVRCVASYRRLVEVLGAPPARVGADP